MIRGVTGLRNETEGPGNMAIVSRDESRVFGFELSEQGGINEINELRVIKRSQGAGVDSKNPFLRIWKKRGEILSGKHVM